MHKFTHALLITTLACAAVPALAADAPAAPAPDYTLTANVGLTSQYVLSRHYANRTKSGHSGRCSIYALQRLVSGYLGFQHQLVLGCRSRQFSQHGMGSLWRLPQYHW